MLSKEILTQYSDLKKEAEDIRLRIENTERQLRQMEEDRTVKDVVKGGRGGIQHFEIEGFPYPAYSQKKTRVYAYKAILESTELELSEKIKEVEMFINSIEDSQIRRIVRYRVIDGLGWSEVAGRMGGANSEDNLRKIYQRFLDKAL